MENKCKGKNETCLNSKISFLGDTKTKGFYKNLTEVLTLPTKYPTSFLQNYLPWNSTTIECENYKKIENQALCPDFNSKLQIKVFF